MKKETQLKIVKDQLLNYGEVSRNWCLRGGITRLASRIGNLKDDGWVFETEKREGDFVYKVMLRPNGGYNWNEETKKYADEVAKIIEDNEKLSTQSLFA